MHIVFIATIGSDVKSIDVLSGFLVLNATGPFLIGTEASSSQVLVVRRSLDVLDVLFLLCRYTAVGQLGIVDLVLTVKAGTCASPVPIEATNVLETSHLFVGQVREDLDHVTTVTINSEHIFVDQVIPPDTLLEEERKSKESTNDPFGIHGVFIQKLVHIYLIINYLLLSVELNIYSNF